MELDFCAYRLMEMDDEDADSVVYYNMFIWMLSSALQPNV